MNIQDCKASDGSYLSSADGGYPLIYICNDGEVVCADCISDPTNAGWAFDETSRARVIAADIFYEGAPETCAHCNKQIESAYGDPDQN